MGKTYRGNNKDKLKQKYLRDKNDRYSKDKHRDVEYEKKKEHREERPIESYLFNR